jgi:hypothetical protein
MTSTTSLAPRNTCRRLPLRLITAATLALLILAFSAAPASATPRRDPQALSQPQAKVAIPPRITAAFRNIALKTSFIKLRAKAVYRNWSDSEVAHLSSEIVKEWVKEQATECPSVLPHWFFCTRPPKPVWGRGVAVQIGRYVPGEFVSPWRVDRGYVRLLRPGTVYWLTCWSLGTKITNAVRYSNYWYRLTDGYWVSDAWLYTGTNTPLRGVANCPA